MGAQLRVLRGRIRSVQSIKKITKAMEMVATSRLGKAQTRMNFARPYSVEITSVLTALASSTSAPLHHPLLVERPAPRRAGVLVVTSDRGLAGSYSSNAIRRAAALSELLHAEGKETVLYVIGRKGVGYYRFRGRELAGEWTGFSEKPTYDDARAVAMALIRAFLTGADGQDEEDGAPGVDELHMVYTRFESMMTQLPAAVRLAPMEVEETQLPPPGLHLPEYEFEPEPGPLLEALLPKYVSARIYAALLESATAESAARRRACKAATDNAEELIKAYTREANQARQAEITQEISEIVGTADALAASGE
ncbi:MAG: F0F1 ATP synthase subunit gamma [Actinobacteria bacterium]|nr:F0F1 ATP synthase subunit gamma [Actinomycetota bacterium]